MESNLQTFPRWNPYASETDKRRYLSRVFDWKDGCRAELRVEITRKMQVRAGSIFDNHFEAGMVYAYLQMLGWQSNFKTRRDVKQFIKEVTYSANTEKEAEEKLKQILGEQI